MKYVTKAEPNRLMAMGSLGDASNMLLQQYQFPNSYRDDEIVIGEYHDRLMGWDYDHWTNIMEKYKSKLIGNYGLTTRFEQSKPTVLLKFLIDILKADTSIKWTGFRILGSVNKSNGYPVYIFQLFAKSPKSKTNVYSDSNAPNVKRKNNVFDDEEYHHQQIDDEEYLMRYIMRKYQ